MAFPAMDGAQTWTAPRPRGLRGTGFGAKCSRRSWVFEASVRGRVVAVALRRNSTAGWLRLPQAQTVASAHGAYGRPSAGEASSSRRCAAPPPVPLRPDGRGALVGSTRSTWWLDLEGPCGARAPGRAWFQEPLPRHGCRIPRFPCPAPEAPGRLGRGQVRRRAHPFSRPTNGRLANRQPSLMLHRGCSLPSAVPSPWSWPLWSRCSRSAASRSPGAASAAGSGRTGHPEPPWRESSTTSAEAPHPPALRRRQRRAPIRLGEGAPPARAERGRQGRLPQRRCSRNTPAEGRPMSQGAEATV
jgi:hypothetical protein